MSELEAIYDAELEAIALACRQHMAMQAADNPKLAAAVASPVGATLCEVAYRIGAYETLRYFGELHAEDAP